MARRIENTTLSASTIDIINTIRANAAPAYQDKVPKIEKTTDIPKVGEVLYGDIAAANEFLSALVNRIALVRINAAVFNNAYEKFKKGYLEYGETIEEVFVGLTKARPFSAEKAEQRELKRTMPDVRSAFHIINWKVQYPITVTMVELNQAFMSAEGVQDLVAKIINQVYTSASYDEFLLFKYLLIKAVAKKNVHFESVKIGADGGSLDNAAIKFRGMFNKLPFMNDKFNQQGVTTATAKEDIYLFMDTDFNATYDVGVLAKAFNMDKAEFEGKTTLIDNWTTFDNDRFSEIMAESDMLEPVTDEDLLAMKNVKAIMLDQEWFQVYDNLTLMTDKFVSSGMYWNYFYNVWKTVSTSPFSNIICFVDSIEPITSPSTITAKVTDKQVDAKAKVSVYTLEGYDGAEGIRSDLIEFVQTEQATTDGVAVHRYGAVILPDTKQYAVQVKLVNTGETYTCVSALDGDTVVGTTFTCNKDV